MGSEMSKFGRSGNSLDYHRSRNNYKPLHFHHVHGENIKLLKSARAAWRAEGFCKGIVFSDRPVAVGERIQIKFLDISANWSGALRIGFTTNDPSTLKSKLPRYACPDLTSSNGNWAKAIAERLAKKDSILSYYVNENGEVHYGIDTEELGVFFGGVNVTSRLWAVLDIYGNTIGVEFVDSQITQSRMEDETITVSIPDAVCIPNNLKIPAEVDLMHCNSNFSFDKVHGENAILKKKGTLVTRKASSNTLAYAFLSDPLKVGQTKVFKVVETDHFRQDTLLYGVTSCNPSSINASELPDCPDDLLDRSDYWVIKQNNSTVEVGDRLFYHLNAEGELKVFKNDSELLESIYVDPTQVLWLFFNLIGTVSALTYVASYTNLNTLCQDFENLNISNSDTSSIAESSSSSSQAPNRECVICCEAVVNSVIYRCGHMCLCYECAQKMWNPSSNGQCPICREPITDIIKIY